MRDRVISLAVGMVLTAVPLTAVRGEVAVVFVEPQKFTDAGVYGYGDAHNLAALERHLRALAARCLRSDEALELQVFDVDLAGRDEWWQRSAYTVRVMRDITWPRIDLGYVWRDGAGVVLGEGREQVVDMSYLWRSGYVRHDSDVLPYEKAMLRDWFQQRFCRAQRSGAAR